MKLPFGYELKKQTIFGSQPTPYMTRMILRKDRESPTRRVQIFYRGDEDPDPHNHPWEFWTFPLTDYWEEVHTLQENLLWRARINLVSAFRWHYRPANYVHRVLDPLEPGGKIITIVKTGPVSNEWGFWEGRGTPAYTRRSYLAGNDNFYEQERLFVPWREYLGLVGGNNGV